MKLILIIDDEEEIREIMGDILRQEGFEIFLAADGKEGVQIAKEKNPSLVILDILMKGQDGLVTISDLLELSAQTKIVAMSGGGAAIEGFDFLTHASSLGAIATLKKPFRKVNLLESVQKVLALEE